MIWKDYRLGKTVLRTLDSKKLWQTEKGVVEIDKNTLAIPIMLDDCTKGYVFHGNGKLLLDTIVETEKGAVGKSIEKELKAPFLMLGDAENLEKSFEAATGEDLARMTYGSQQDFADKAEDLLSHLSKKRTSGDCCGLRQDQELVFAFANQTDEPDLLIANGSKVVYKGKNMVFVSDENNTVLKSPDEIVCSNNGKSVIVKGCNLPSSAACAHLRRQRSRFNQHQSGCW